MVTRRLQVRVMQTQAKSSSILGLRISDLWAKKKVQKEELMAQMDWGVHFYSAAAESLTTSVLIMTTDSWQKTADR